MFCLNHIGNHGLLKSPHRKIANRALLSLVLLTSLSGCSYLEPSWDYDESMSDDLVIMNAERRVIFFSDKGVPHGGENTNLQNKASGHEQRQRGFRPKVICAEPSPDVVSQLALSGGLNALTQTGNSTEANLAIAAAVSRLSNRTQTIQLLRDGLYRACEAYFNGVLEEEDYKSIIKGYDELLITLVAIEGLSSMGEDGRTMSLMVNLRPGSPEAKSEPAGNNKPRSDKVMTEKNQDMKSGKKAKSLVSESKSITRDPAASEHGAVASKIQKIVRDYYCFQLGLKEKFYPASQNTDEKAVRKEDDNIDKKAGGKKHDKRYGKFSNEVLSHLCSGKGIEPVKTANSVNRIPVGK